jgi:hypothetical protein
MADNVAITPGTGATVGADEIGGILFQRVKVIVGADGTNNGDVSSANPMPVSGTVTVTGSTAVVSMPAVTGSVTLVGVSAITGSTSVVNTVTVTGSTTVVGTVTVTGITTVIGAISAVTAITNPVTITGSTVVLSMPAVTGSVTLVGTSAVTGSVTVIGMPTTTITGSTTVIGMPAITGSVTLVGVSTITGSTTVIGMPAVTGSVTLVGTSNVNTTLKTGRFSGAVTTTDCTTAIQVIAAVAGQFAYVSSYMISAIAAGQYWLEDGAATALTPRHFLAANGGVSYTTVDGMPIATAISNTTIKVKSTVAGSTGCLVVGYNAAG